MRIAEKKRQIERRNKRKRRRPLGMKMVLAVVLMVFLGVSLRSINLYEKKAENDAKVAELETQLAQEESRANELDAYEDYVGTDEYIEQVAKDRLGLAYPNETLLRPEED